MIAVISGNYVLRVVGEVQSASIDGSSKVVIVAPTCTLLLVYEEKGWVGWIAKICEETGSFKWTCGGRNIESDIVGSKAIILLILAWRKYAKLKFILSLAACLFQVTYSLHSLSRLSANCTFKKSAVVAAI